MLLTQARIVLPVLGVNLLRSTSIARAACEPGNGTGSPVFTLTLTQPRDRVDGLTRDSTVSSPCGHDPRPPRLGGVETNTTALRQRLEGDGTLVVSNDGFTREFTRDHVFSNPSAAAAVLLGRSSNGRLGWRVQGSGVSYGDWQSAQIAEIAPPQPAE